MKTSLFRMMSLFAMILGLASYQTANAEAAHDSGSAGIRNTESNYFADFTGTFTITVTYVCDSPYYFTNTITAYCYLPSTQTLSPSETKYYFSELSSAASAAAYYDAVYNNFEDAPVSVNIDSIDDFSFDTNTCYQIQSVAPTSTNSSVAVNNSWSPALLNAGSGGTNMFCVAGYTNWGTDDWVPTATGVYYFYVAIKSDPGYTANAIDPIQGPMEVNFSSYVVVIY